MNDDDDTLEERRVGTHTMRFRPPDVVVVTLVGTIEPSDLHGFHGWLDRFAEDKRWIFAIADMSRVTSLPMRSRQTAKDGSARMQAVAVIGASRTIQLIVTVLHKAITLLRREAMKPLAFVDTEAEGHAFINDCRRALEAKASHRGDG